MSRLYVFEVSYRRNKVMEGCYVVADSFVSVYPIVSEWLGIEATDVACCKQLGECLNINKLPACVPDRSRMVDHGEADP